MPLCPTIRQELLQTKRATALRFAWPATAYVAWHQGLVWCMSNPSFQANPRNLKSCILCRECAVRLGVGSDSACSYGEMPLDSVVFLLRLAVRGCCQLSLALRRGRARLVSQTWAQHVGLGEGGPRPIQGRIPDPDASALSAAAWAAEAAEAAATVARLCPAWQIKATTVAKDRQGPGLIDKDKSDSVMVQRPGKAPAESVVGCPGWCVWHFRRFRFRVPSIQGAVLGASWATPTLELPGMVPLVWKAWKSGSSCHDAGQSRNLFRSPSESPLKLA